MFSATSRGIPTFGDQAWKRPVPNVSVGALSASTLSPAAGVSFGQTLTKTTNGALGSEANIASLSGLAVGDRILITGEASPKNGVYVITSLGSAGTKWQLTRATDADSAVELPTGTMVFDQAISSLWTTTGGAGGAFINVPITYDHLALAGTAALEFYSNLAAVAGLSGDARIFRSAAKTITIDDDTGNDLTLLKLLAASVYTATGTSNPTVAGEGSATFANKTCVYVRLGKLVVFYINFDVTANGSGGTNVSLTNTGLPQAAFAGVFMEGGRGSVGVLPLGWRMLNSGGELMVGQIRRTDTDAIITGAQLVNGASYTVHGAYLTA